MNSYTPVMCVQISSADPKDDVPYSFLGALEEGYFSDVTILGETGRQVSQHSTAYVLDMCCLVDVCGWMFFLQCY